MDAGGDAAHETMLGIHRQEDERHCVFQQLVIRHQFAFALVNKKTHSLALTSSRFGGIIFLYWITSKNSLQTPADVESLIQLQLQTNKQEM